MQNTAGRWRFSAWDLRWAAVCPRRTALDRELALGQHPAPPPADDPFLGLLAKRGTEHEAACVSRFAERGPDVVSIAAPGPSEATVAAAAAATTAAMAAGAAVIHGGTLISDRFHGRPDFLLRVDTPSHLGAHSYEPADAKLRQTPSPDDWLQVALYARLLEPVLGHLPTAMHLYLGAGDTAHADPADHAERLDMVAESLARTVADHGVVPPAEPISACSKCRWNQDCDAVRAAEDHLSLVGIRRKQRGLLTAAGVTTARGLAELADGVDVDGIPTLELRRLRSDARLALRERDTGEPHLRLRWPRPGRGLDAVPEPTAHDLYLDLEGDATGDSLEYLIGLTTAPPDPQYTAIWSHNLEDEKHAFEQLIATLVAHLTAHPDAHIVHYASYEPAALRRLARRHNVPEEEVEVVETALVDLLPVVRDALRTSSLSAGLKAVEPFYRPDRVGAVTAASASVVAYDEWRHTSDPRILTDLEAYNRDDCLSLAELHHWLASLAADVESQAVAPVPAPDVEQALEEHDLSLRLRTLATLPGHPGRDDIARAIRRTLVQAELDHPHVVSDAPELLAVTHEDVAAMLTLGKKEVGLPIRRSLLLAATSERS